jgi:hypothetical protein
MEIVAGAMLVTTVCLAAGFVTLRGAGAAAEVMTQMFSSPADLGWPTGVQEDDDHHWCWAGLPAVDEAPASSGFARGEVTTLPGPGLRPELVELPRGTGPRALPVARH